MTLFVERLVTRAQYLTSSNCTLPSNCQIHLSVIDVSKTFESLQNNLPHFRSIKTSQLDNSPRKSSPSARGSQEGYGPHYPTFMKSLAGDEKPNLSSVTQEEDYIKSDQESQPPFDASAVVAKSSELSQVIASYHEFSRVTPFTVYDENKKDTSNSFKFLDLPREIRDLIYRSALVNCAGGRLILATTAKEKADKWSISEDFAPNINLMFTCKQVKTEAQSIFYRNNTFIVRNCIPVSVPECFPGSLVTLLKSIELQFTVAHCQFSCRKRSSQRVCTGSLSFDNIFALHCDHSKRLTECWSSMAQLITKLPSLQDLTINVADTTLQHYSRRAQLWLISLSLAELRKRQEMGFDDCRLHVTGLLLQYFDWFLQVSQPNKAQENFYAKKNELNILHI